MLWNPCTPLHFIPLLSRILHCISPKWHPITNRLPWGPYTLGSKRVKIFTGLTPGKTIRVMACTSFSFTNTVLGFTVRKTTLRNMWWYLCINCTWYFQQFLFAVWKHNSVFTPLDNIFTSRINRWDKNITLYCDLIFQYYSLSVYRGIV